MAPQVLDKILHWDRMPAVAAVALDSHVLRRGLHIRVRIRRGLHIRVHILHGLCFRGPHVHHNFAGVHTVAAARTVAVHTAALVDKPVLALEVLGIGRVVLDRWVGLAGVVLDLQHWRTAAFDLHFAFCIGNC